LLNLIVKFLFYTKISSTYDLYLDLQAANPQNPDHLAKLRAMLHQILLYSTILAHNNRNIECRLDG